MSDPPDFSLFSPVFGLLDLTGFCPIMYTIGYPKGLKKKQVPKTEKANPPGQSKQADKEVNVPPSRGQNNQARVGHLKATWGPPPPARRRGRDNGSDNYEHLIRLEGEASKQIDQTFACPRGRAPKWERLAFCLLT